MSNRHHTPRRSIEAVVFEGELGILSAHELLEMPEDEWGIIRDRLTDSARGTDDNLAAKCLMCGSPVYIKTRKIRGKPLPLFAHFKGGDHTCPWYHGESVIPDDARASQYGGRQESLPHRQLCEQVDRLVRLDPRYTRSTVDTYLPPTEHKRGRFPDVYVEWEGVRPFAVEVQLSNTFQTEISERYRHYEREGVDLIWLLFGLDTMYGSLSQSFRDVIRRHRGNAFTIDRESIAASLKHQTLVLKCYLRAGEDSFEEPKLVSFDDLTFPSVGLAYFEDRLIEPMLSRCKKSRKHWFRCLDDVSTNWDWRKWDEKNVEMALAEVRDIRTDLRRNSALFYVFLKLVAVVLSVISEANGNFKNLLSRQPNATAMLNSFLSNRSEGLERYASIIEYLLVRTACNNLLSGSVAKHIREAKQRTGEEIAAKRDWEWKALWKVVPEIFDPYVRETLEYFGTLPVWAIPRR